MRHAYCVRCAASSKDLFEKVPSGWKCDKCKAQGPSPAEVHAALKVLEAAEKAIPSRVCSTCKHWGKDGACHKILKDNAHIVYCNRNECTPELETQPDFGCNQWEAKA